jgi:hypothetical protein
VLEGAGVALVPQEVWEERRAVATAGSVGPAESRANSTVLSFRTDGPISVETDYLNGEIVLQARLASLLAPINEAFQRCTNVMARQRLPLGSIGCGQIAANALRAGAGSGPSTSPYSVERLDLLRSVVASGCRACTGPASGATGEVTGGVAVAPPRQTVE